MQAENLDDLFQRGLEFAWDCEHELVRDLPKVSEAAHSEQLRAAFLEHGEETRGHILRLEKVFATLGRAPAAETSAPVRAATGEAAKLIRHIERSPLRDAALIFNAIQIEHYEIALYGSLSAFARTLGRTDAARLLELTLAEEKAADQKLSALAEGSVNPAASNSQNAPPFAFI